MVMNAKNVINQEFQKRKNRNPNFSLRAFARYLGFSPAQLSQMMSGKRPITLNAAKKFSERLGYSPQEKEKFLKTLMSASENLADTPRLAIRQLQEDQFRFIADWYHLAILSLTKIKNSKADPSWIARRLGITISQAHQALLRLTRLHLLRLHPRLEQVGEPFEVVSQIPSEAIRTYHKQNLNLALEKIEMVPVQNREFQSISIALSPKQVPQFKKLIDNFLEQAMADSQHQAGTEVYHLNVQLFPVTQSKENQNEK